MVFYWTIYQFSQQHVNLTNSPLFAEYAHITALLSVLSQNWQNPESGSWIQNDRMPSEFPIIVFHQPKSRTRSQARQEPEGLLLPLLSYQRMQLPWKHATVTPGQSNPGKIGHAYRGYLITSVLFNLFSLALCVRHQQLHCKKAVCCSWKAARFSERPYVYIFIIKETFCTVNKRLSEPVLARCCGGWHLTALMFC